MIHCEIERAFEITQTTFDSLTSSKKHRNLDD